MPEGPRYLLELGCGLWAVSAEVNTIYPTPGDPHRKSTKWHFLPCHRCLCDPSWQNWGLIPPRHSGWSSHAPPWSFLEDPNCHLPDMSGETLAASSRHACYVAVGWDRTLKTLLDFLDPTMSENLCPPLDISAFFFCLSSFQFGSCHLGMKLACWLLYSNCEEKKQK